MAAPRSALFVIDIQKDLASNPATQIPHAERINRSGSSLLHAARSINDSYLADETATTPCLIIFVQHEELRDSGSLVKGSEAWKLVFEPRAGVEEEIHVGKKTGDTFESNPDLAQRLRAAGVEEIIAFGIQSEYCVEATCKGALAKGFGVTLLAGAHSTYDDGGKTAVEIENEVQERLTSRGVKMVGWEEAAARWSKEKRVC